MSISPVAFGVFGILEIGLSIKTSKYKISDFVDQQHFLELYLCIYHIRARSLR
jgi:hypothetical protein